MHAHFLRLTLVLIACLIVPRATAQSAMTANTLALDEDPVSPAATLSDASWLVGAWRGEALGGTADEVWAEPVGNAMLGMFRLAHGDSVRFYEIMTLSQEEETLVLRVKHFDPDLTGWEEPDEAHTTELVRREPDALYFHGLTFKPIGRDSLLVHVAFGQGDGSFREEIFRYRRAD